MTSTMRTVSTSDTEQLHSLAKHLARSKRVAFLVGAGISTAADIPDFRSASTGLFASLKERNPELKISSGKDLFNARLFQREDTTRAFYMMCAELKRLADAAGPTEAHKLMADLEEAGKLFRIYTQNIDALEAKAGLSYGLGEWKESVRTVSSTTATSAGTSPSKVNKGKGKAPAERATEDAASVSNENRQLEDLQSTVLSSSSTTPEENVEREEPVASTSKLPDLERMAFMGEPEEPASSQASTAVVPESPDQVQNSDISMISVEQEGSTQEVPETQEMQEADMGLLVQDEQVDLEAPMSSLPVDGLQGDAPNEPTEPPPASGASASSDIELPTPSSSQNAPPPSQPKSTTTTKRSLTVPRVIPLHGSLDEMHCPKCTHIEPLQRWVHILASGHSIHCPHCLTLDSARIALGERSRGVGVMKVSVVLYGEEHKQASRVGEITEKDLLKAARPDFLVVAGTTLKIPGVKKLVREMSRLIKQLNEYDEEELDENGQWTGRWLTKKVESSIPRVIFVNMDPPAPEKAWNDVFDVHVQGDVQTFASIVRQELAALSAKKQTLPSGSQASIVSTAALLAPEHIYTHQPTLSNYFNASKVTVGSLQLGKKGKAGAVALAGGLKENKKEMGIKAARAKQSSSASKKNKKHLKKAKKASPTPSLPAIVAPIAPQPPKEKTKPGWRGYALALVEEIVPKHADHWAETLPEGLKRQRKPVVIAPAPARVLSQSALRPKGKGKAKARLSNITTPSSTSAVPAPLQSTPARCKPIDEAVASLAAKTPTELSAMLSQQLGSAFSPLRKLALSNASTPPSLASDVETASDVEETASVKGEIDIGPSSQETDIVPDSVSISPEGAEALLVGPESSLESLTKSTTTITISDSQPSQPSDSRLRYYSPILTEEGSIGSIEKHASYFLGDMSATETESEDPDATDDDYEMQNMASAKKARMEMSPPDKKQTAIMKRKRVTKGRQSTAGRKRGKKSVAA